MAKVTEVDIVTGLLFTIKRPSPEIITVSVDFKRHLTTIASVTSITPQPRGKVTQETALTVTNSSFTGSIITFDINGGTDKEDYEIQITVVDSAGKPKVEDILIKCRIPGTEWT